MLRSRCNLAVAPVSVNGAGDAEMAGRGVVTWWARLAAVMLGLMAMSTACSSDRDPVASAITIAEDDGAFGNGPEAGESLARIAQHLEDARTSCDEADGARCAALGVASGYAQVLAAQVLQCTAPGRFEARVGMLELLEAVDGMAPDAADLPEPPPLPDCT